MPPKQSSIQYTSQQVKQLTELEQAGYGNWTQIIRLALDAYYNHYLSQQEITILSRKVAEQSAHPELTELDGKLWLNLGSGLLAESAAAMLVQQFPTDVEAKRTAIEEWLIHHKQAAQDGYALFRAVIMFKFT